jgi:hypothetical protein
VQLFPLIAGGDCRGFFDVADAPDLPLFQHGIEQGLTVLEVPVETALGDPAALGQNFHPQAADALVGEDVDCLIHPAFGSSWVRGATARLRVCWLRFLAKT